MAVVSQSDYSIVITGGKIRIPGEWKERTGGAKQRNVEAYFNGGDNVPQFLVGKATGDDMTLTRGYDPKVDDVWLSQLNAAMERDECWYTPVQTPKNRQGAVYGKPRSWPNIPVKSLKFPEGNNSDAAEASTIEIVFATRGPGAS